MSEGKRWDSVSMNSPVGDALTGKGQQVRFESGIPGFDDLRDFVIVPYPEDSPFWMLQSLEKEEVGFVLVNPFDTYANYEVDLPESALEALEAERAEDVAVFAFVTIRQPVEASTVNLAAPVVINRVNRKGTQAILADERLSTREPLFSGSSVGEAR